MRKNGFTMVELMIVIAIIAVLASIIMPKLGGARDKAAFESCKQNVKNIATALEMYAAASNGSYGTSTSSVNSGYILVTKGYLKPTTCPIGNRYYVWLDYPGAGWMTPPLPACAYLVFCFSEPGQGTPHNGYQADIPMIYHGSNGVRLKY